MSCDWEVHCLDCHETHEFMDANHRDDLMASLCKHAAKLGAIAEVQDDMGWELELSVHYGRIDAAWFKKHAEHRLEPISEYGDLKSTKQRCTCRVF